jgi:peptide deformylase
MQSGMVFLNPTVVSRSPSTAKLREACISLPDIEARVERHKMIEVRAVVFTQEKFVSALKALKSASLFKKDLSAFFEEETVQLLGKTAQIFQHELDHLDGVLFTDRMYLMTDKRSVKPKLDGLKREAEILGVMRVAPRIR